MALYNNVLSVPTTGGVMLQTNTVADFVFKNVVDQSMPPVTVISSSPGGNNNYSSYVLKVANSGHYLSIATTNYKQLTIGIYNIAYSSIISSIVFTFNYGDSVINNILTTSNLLSFSTVDVSSGGEAGITYFNTNNNNWYAAQNSQSQIYPPNSDSTVIASISFGYCASTNTYLANQTLLSIPLNSSFNPLSIISDIPIPIVAFSGTTAISGLSSGYAYTGAGLNWLYSGYMICADNA